MDILRGIGFILMVIGVAAVLAFGGTVLAVVGFIATLALIGAVAIAVIIVIFKDSANNKNQG